MDSSLSSLFEEALGLELPWYVDRVEFDGKASRLDLYLDFEVGGTFQCGTCGRQGCKAYDTTVRQWRHLNFFEHEVVLHAPSPRTSCPSCGVRQAALPWARSRSRFTVHFEALTLGLANRMPLRRMAMALGEHDTRLRRIVKNHAQSVSAIVNADEVAHLLDQFERRESGPAPGGPAGADNATSRPAGASDSRLHAH